MLLPVMIILPVPQNANCIPALLRPVLAAHDGPLADTKVSKVAAPAQHPIFGAVGLDRQPRRQGSAGGDDGKFGSKRGFGALTFFVSAGAPSDRTGSIGWKRPAPDQNSTPGAGPYRNPGAGNSHDG